jgi:glyoxylase-like metal-dependent hydrolase (beta-lactamase superfamily II)
MSFIVVMIISPPWSHGCEDGSVTLAPIDLVHQGLERIIGVYLLETSDGLALADCGPATTAATLESALAERGVALTDVRHLLLSHIHLDHAGATGTLVRGHPGLKVHVSPVGAPHLVDPSRLERSARRLYGDRFDSLWGPLEPVPERNVVPTDRRVLEFDVFPTPGHASHHVCYLGPDGTLLAGDAAGVRIVPDRYILPASPPPDIDVEAWNETFDEIERRGPDRIALTHFGVVEDVTDHMERVREELAVWAERVRSGMTQEQFLAAARADIARFDGEDIPYYERAGPVDQSFLGLRRYWDKRAEAEAAATA